MKKSKFYRVAVAGATTDGRIIEASWIQQMAKNYNPNTYTALANIEHIRGISPSSEFGNYAKVLGLKAQEDDINGQKKWCLYAQLEAFDNLIELHGKKQKLFNSIEVNPSFADTNEAYLVGIAFTDTPASLGTQIMEFASKNPEANPFTSKKQHKDNLFTAAEEVDQRWTNAVAKAIALDRIMIGFNGTSAAATTDRSTNTKLQDVNIGWLQKIRTNAPDRVMSTVTVGAAGTYKNLDALVVDAVNELIDEVHQDDTDLIVICGRSLLADKNFPIVNDASDNTNVLAGQVLLSQKQIGGLPAARVPHFPDNALLITSFDNLSIYYQKDAKRRYIQEKPSKNRIEDYQSSNEAYVIEAYEKVALVEGITIE